MSTHEPEDDFLVPSVTSQDDTSRDPEIWDVVVVGGGLTGAAFAKTQGEAGRRVLVLERDLSQPDRIVGELLQPGGLAALQRLGLGAAVEGIGAVEVEGYALFKDGRCAELAYPRLGDGDDAGPAASASGRGEAGPRGSAGGRAHGRSFHNGRFVQRVRQLASEAPGVTFRRGTARGLVGEDGSDWRPDRTRPGTSYASTAHPAVGGVRYGSEGGEDRVARARLVVACDGIFSSMRARLSVPDVTFPSYFVGIVLRGCRLPFPSRGHVILTSPSPVLFYPISDTEVRCLVDVPGHTLPSASDGSLQRHIARTLVPQVPEPMRAPLLAALEGGSVRSMQNRRLWCAPFHAPGAFMLGDSFNMRHPLTGGGMTVALRDVELAASLLGGRADLDLADKAAAADALSRFYNARKPWASTINTLANALYAVFSDDPARAAAVAASPSPGCDAAAPATDVSVDARADASGGAGAPPGLVCDGGVCRLTSLAAPRPRARRPSAHEEMREACFLYLSKGGRCADGPVGLLSGLDPSPVTLITHFFSVALFSSARLLTPRPTLRGLWTAFAVLFVACRIILPILHEEGWRAVFLPRIAPRVPGAGVRRAKAKAT